MLRCALKVAVVYSDFIERIGLILKTETGFFVYVDIPQLAARCFIR
jgi:hypothetical protein